MKKLLLNKLILQHWNLFSFITIFLGGVWILFSAGYQNNLLSIENPLPQKGFLAPDFELVSLDGQQIKLTQFRGTPVIINFWASWCQPCRIEMPAIQNALKTYADQQIMILAVNMTNQDNETQVRAFVQELNLSFPVLLDQASIAGSLYQVSALPTTYFVRSDGIINEVVIGGPMSEALLLTRIENLLNQR